MGIVKTSTKSLIHLKASLPIRGASFGTNQPPDAIRQLIRRWLTDQEADNILLRFQKACIPNRQVLWSGMLREQAQQWADAHGFQTLTTALGPLLNPDDLGYPHRRNSPSSQKAEAVEPSTKSITNEKNVMMEGGRQKKKKKKKKASSVRNKKADKTTAEKVPKLDSCVNNLSLIKKGRDK
ncbi:hypothetical protein QWA68_015758 [Fusarium oxysporum]|nr:hypothetical protein QWA68_015758 [Fusarium oxysporum]